MNQNKNKNKNENIFFITLYMENEDKILINFDDAYGNREANLFDFFNFQQIENSLENVKTKKNCAEINFFEFCLKLCRKKFCEFTMHAKEFKHNLGLKQEICDFLKQNKVTQDSVSQLFDILQQKKLFVKKNQPFLNHQIKVTEYLHFQINFKDKKLLFKTCFY
jgi:hypothetical protein